MAVLDNWMQDEYIRYTEVLCSEARVRNAGCSKCKAVCPQNSITVNGKVCIDTQSCSKCGACAAVCPTGALAGSGSVYAAVSHSARTDKLDILCRAIDRTSSIDCLGGLTPIMLTVWAITYGKVEIGVDITKCRQCKGDIQRYVHETVAVANQFLQKIDCLPIICAPRKSYQDKTTLSRRDLFGMLKRMAVDSVEQVVGGHETPKKNPREDLIEKLQDRSCTKDHDGTPFFFGAAADECHMCGLCTKICKYDALSIQHQEDCFTLYHNQSKCVGCGACVAICPQKTLQVRCAYSDLNLVTNRQATVVASKETRVCPACHKPFVVRRDETECDSCQYQQFGRIRQSLF